MRTQNGREKKAAPAICCETDGLFVGVPVVLGAGGLERIFEIELRADEQAAFDVSAAAVRELVDKLPA